ncbi:MAG: energy transducer TonB [Balneolaceae bacterium]|nr:energy transducer TonB [Balneolaceae bacterium]
MNTLEKLDNEDRFALYISGGVHLALIAFFILYSFTINPNVRPSFIEVEFGEYKSGTMAEFSEQTNEEVATSPNPSEVEPEDPQPDQPEPVEEQVATTAETTKPVDVPDQKEEVQEEELKTPETDKVDPEKETSTEKKEEVVVPPKAKQAETQQQGAENSGDEQGNQGRVNADQGTGNELEKAAPFNLNIEGINRDPLVKPIPDNSSGYEATVTIRFEVTPDGRVTNIIPIRKSGNPEIDREVIRTLNSWRFSRLPSNVPQQNQTGTITFRFVLD